MNDVQDRFYSLLSAKIGVETESLTEDTTLESLDLDSLLLVEVSVAVEKEFGVAARRDCSSRPERTSRRGAAAASTASSGDRLIASRPDCRRFDVAVTGRGPGHPGRDRGRRPMSSPGLGRHGPTAARRSPDLDRAWPVDISCRGPRGFDANALLGRSTAWRLRPG